MLANYYLSVNAFINSTFSLALYVLVKMLNRGEECDSYLTRVCRHTFTADENQSVG